MIADLGLLGNPALDAGMAVPEELMFFDKEDFPHWQVFLTIQVGRPMPNPDSHWKNAKIIAGLSVEHVKNITYEQLAELGLE